MADVPPPKSRLFWILAIALLVVVAIIFMLRTTVEETPETAGETAAAGEAAGVPPDEYIVAPEDEGVEVDLPETAPAVVPVDEAAE